MPILTVVSNVNVLHRYSFLHSQTDTSKNIKADQKQEININMLYREVSICIDKLICSEISRYGTL